MKNIFFITIVLFFVSCAKEEKIDALIGDDKISLRTIIEDPLVISNLKNAFYAKKESNTYSSILSPKLTFGGETKENIEYLKINNLNVEKTKSNRFFKHFTTTTSNDQINNSFLFEVSQDENQEIPDVKLKFNLISGTLRKGDIIRWDAGSDYTNGAVLTVKQNSISSDGTIINLPKFNYIYLPFNSFKINDDFINSFSDGDEVTISIAVANYKISNQNIYAVVDLKHSGTFIVKK